MMSRESLAVVKAIYDAFSAGNMAGALALMDPGIVWYEAENYPYAGGNPYVGPEVVAAGVFAPYGTDWDGFAVHIAELIDGGESVVALGRYTGTYRPTGKPMDLQVAHVWRIADGRAVHFQQYADTLAAARTVGSV
jgi:ketosteroid isomerase-like protein